ncbi:MAG: type II secretion system protein GspC [Thermodesulfobacteriota bacterium]
MAKKAVIIANLLLITLTVYFGVDLFYAVAAGRLNSAALVVPSSGRGTATPPRPVSKRPLSAYTAIASRNVFKAVPSAAVAQSVINVDNLKKTDLALKLMGTISGLGEKSCAIIERTRERQQGLYKAGDTVESATVKHILRKKVVLTLNGVDEVLEMTEESITDGARPGGLPPVRRGGPAERVTEKAASVRNVTLNRSEVEGAFNNVNDLMQSVRIRPHFTDGKPDGLSLDSVAPESIFQEMGLQSKDVIVGVNGKKISTVDDCMEVYKSLSEASAVVLEVNRDGQRELIHYNVQ